MRFIRRLSVFALLSAVLALCFGSAASAASDWSETYQQYLKQHAGVKRATVLVDLSGDGTPELVSLTVGATGVGALSVACVANGAVKEMSSDGTLFNFDSFRFKGVSSVSMQLRKASGGGLCLSANVLQRVGGARITTRVAFVEGDSASSLTPVYLSSKTSTDGATKYSIGANIVSEDKFMSAQAAFNASYPQAGGNLPLKTIARSDKASAIQAKFTALLKQYASCSTASGIRLSKTALSLVAGNSATLTVAVKPASAVMDTVSFESSNKAIATVGAKGKVTGVSAGRATITASTLSGKRKTCAVTVTGTQSAKVTGVELDRTALTLIKGEADTLIATIQPIGASASLSWSSSNPSVATVSQRGKVLAHTKGKAVITVKTANGKTAKCKIVVNSTPAVIVDISSHNYSTSFDWAKIAKNVDLLILRCGVTRTETAPIGVGKDDKFAYFAQQCKTYGIPFGVYFYGKCASVDEAKEEAQMTWSVASPYKPLFYVYDVEEACLNKEKIETYMKTLKALGAKKTGYYIAHHRYASYNLDTSLVDFIWLPHYGSNNGSVNSTPSYACDIHQYTSRGRLPGFPSGMNLDINRLMGGKTLSWFLGND